MNFPNPNIKTTQAMIYKHIILILALALSQTQANALELLSERSDDGLVALRNTEGVRIKARIDSYDADNKVVTIRVNGTGSLTPVKMDILNENSQEKVMDWYRTYLITKDLRIESERIPDEDESSKRLYKITLSNSSTEDIKDLTFKYFIPYKKSSMVLDEDSNSSSNSSFKSKIKRYKRVETKEVIKGDIAATTVEARAAKTISTESFHVREAQVIKYSEDYEKTYNNKHSPKGLYLKIYLGDKLIREHESQNGVIQLIEKYVD